MSDPRLQRSSPLIRSFKWLGLWAGFLGILYVHYNQMSPTRFNIQNQHQYVHADDRSDIIGHREELFESISKYTDHIDDDNG